MRMHFGMYYYIPYYVELLSNRFITSINCENVCANLLLLPPPLHPGGGGCCSLNIYHIQRNCNCYRNLVLMSYHSTSG